MNKDNSAVETVGGFSPTWMIDEQRHVGLEHLDIAYAARYDRKAQHDPTSDIELLRRRGLNAESLVVDFGAGTGTFAMAVAEHCSKVIAVEPSAAMLAVLGEKADAAEVNNLVPIQSGVLSYTHEGPLADFVYSRNALHHLPDFWKALALSRIADVMKPGGVLYLRDIVYSFDLVDTPLAIEAWIRAGAASSAEGWTPEELAQHVREEHSTFTWLMEVMLERADFEVAEASFSESAIFASYLCVKR